MSSSDEESVLSSAAAIMMRHGQKEKWYKKVSHRIRGSLSGKKKAKRFTKSAENLNQIENKVLKKVCARDHLGGSLLSLPGLHRTEWSDTEFASEEEGGRDDESWTGISRDSDIVTEHDSVSQIDIQVTLAKEAPGHDPHPLPAVLPHNEHCSNHYLCVPHEDSDASDVSDVGNQSRCGSVCDTLSVDSVLQVNISLLPFVFLFFILSEKGMR